MSAWLADPRVAWAFEAVSVVAACIFYGRFYLQWIASEIKKESVVPVAFWYMSAVGSFLLLNYGAYKGSPPATLSHTFNIIIYSRNLMHVWGEHGQLTRRAYWGLHAVMTAIVTYAMVLLVATWLREYQTTSVLTEGEARRTWGWIAIGAAGQGLFACRFLIQWIATERAKKSVIPVSFWYISIVAAALLLSSHLDRGEWVFVFGFATTIPIYVRNVWLNLQDRPQGD